MNSSTLVRNGLCMAIAALAAHPLHAATVTVSTSADLLTAMQNAASGDTIQIAPGEYDITGVADNTTFHLYSGDKTLTLEGTDATSWRDRPSRETATVLKGGSSSRLMLGYSGSLTLKHITFKGASHTGYGAALQRNVRGVAVVTNCVFASNSCTLLGAAAYCPDGVFQDCLFKGNTSDYGGGAAYFGEFHSCEFDSNTGARGGAVLDVNAYDCVFTNNTASMFGGTAYYSSSSHTMRDCTILASRTTAQHGLGGAVYQDNGTISVEGCTFSGCIANGGYTADGYRAGGAICENGGTAEISNSTFTNCTAITYGGAIYCKSGTASMRNCDFLVCSGVYGGAVFSATAGQSGQFENCDFMNCSSSRIGGAIYFATNGVLDGCSFVGDKTTGQEGLGGAIYHNGGSLSMTKCSFDGCQANGGYAVAGYRAGGAICENGGSAEISNSTFTNCTAITYGGAIFCKSGTASLSGCSFIGNVAQSGGALYDGARGAFVTNCTFSANNATSAGGAVGNCTNVVACSFANNTNAYFGAHCFRSIVRDSRFIGDGGVGNSRLVRCVLDGVHTTGDNLWNRAAVIAVKNSAPDFSVEAVNCLFVNCNCFYLLQSWGLPLGIVNCTFANNSLGSYFAFGDTYESAGSAWSFANSIFAGNSRSNTGVGLEIKVASGVALDLDVRNCLSDAGYDIPAASESPVRTVSTSEANTGLAKFVGPGHYSGAPAYTPNLSCSQVVNHGLALDWTASDIDLAGNPRIFGGAVDLGCYECCYIPHGTVLSIR